MGREAVGAHRGEVVRLGEVGLLEPTLDHPPPHEPLAAPGGEDQAQAPQERAGQGPAGEEVRARHGKGDAQDAPPHAVRVLPEEDALELFHVHEAVHPLELRRPAVLCELGLPLFLRLGPSLPREFPVRHREPRAREAGDAAHHDHAEDPRAAAPQPGHDRDPVRRRHARPHADH